VSINRSRSRASRRGCHSRAGQRGGAGALAAKTAAPSTAIVFGTTGDPVEEGLVASLNRPGGNATGVNCFVREVIAKRMQFLRELVPYAKRIALLVNPTDAENYQSSLRDVRAAAFARGRPDELTVNRLRGRALPADEELPLMSAYPAAALPSARPPPATPPMAPWGAQEAAAGSRTY
jgi:ABC transporter substrate binding protein